VAGVTLAKDGKKMSGSRESTIDMFGKKAEKRRINFGLNVD
jgi:hypothetical protein